MDSDDSDFYGDADSVSALESRIEDFDVSSWRQRHSQSKTGRPLLPSSAPGLADTASSTVATRLHNPYAGVPYAWQLTESVDAFLDRLPPQTTTGVPWIFICNPYIARVEKRVSDVVQSKGAGNGDEAPDEAHSDVAIVVEGGTERLAILKRFVDRLRSSGRPKSIVERDVARETKMAANDVLNLAHAYKVRPGKVNDVWAVVARATADNELGIAAKVAPKSDMDEDPRKDRLICIYTADFKDTADVARVVRKLREIGLVNAKGRPIYYKPDVFTYIGIASGNPWGIRPSLYSSTSMLR
ncbi:protein of unknown function (DUF1917) [Geosmithia morbida]|uniref:DUF1917-domain-containing protein n=1 Tax=Geosmithia morbida TaxID=1094350 RepID=A0A9P4YV38_9HYPO|nr:protein of unknown function (DUF1917) [Geosmithia morbida]KAF4121544.1 protein of unknown function (DUF1917) [Geosmithia morbida]